MPTKPPVVQNDNPYQLLLDELGSAENDEQKKHLIAPESAATPSTPKPVIKHVVSLGDSLSDRGTFDKRRILDVIPADRLAGLKGHSPLGRFTNGLVWTDYLATMVADDFIKKQGDGAPKKGVKEGHDHFLSAKQYAERLCTNGICLDEDVRISYKGHDFFRTFDEGGLTAKSYAGKLSYSISRFFTRLIVAVLGEKRKRLFRDDEAHSVSDEHKRETLVMEWSGANDLITVNDHPSYKEANDAIRARIQNVRLMIEQGYKNFMLFNMPDLSLTPRYQRKSKGEQDHAQEVSRYFNRELSRQVAQLRLEFYSKGCHFDIFNAEAQLSEVYRNPSEFGFNSDKKAEPYVDSEAFKVSEDHIFDSQGHMFWDDVHPTTHLHRVLAMRAYQQFHEKYNVQMPTKTFQDEAEHQNERALIEVFKHAYLRKFTHDKHSFGASLRRSRIKKAIANDTKYLAKRESGEPTGNLKPLSLRAIISHALLHDGGRTHQVLKDINWIHDDNSLKLDNAALREAHTPIHEAYLEQEVIRAQAMIAALRR